MVVFAYRAKVFHSSFEGLVSMNPARVLCLYLQLEILINQIQCDTDLTWSAFLRVNLLSYC